MLRFKTDMKRCELDYSDFIRYFKKDVRALLGEIYDLNEEDITIEIRGHHLEDEYEDIINIKICTEDDELEYALNDSDYFDFSDYMKHVRGDLFKEIIYDILEGVTMCW